MSTTTAHPARHGRLAGFGHFVLHFFEMCMPMCIGWAVGDVIYFAIADQLGSSDPFTRLARAVAADRHLQHDRADGRVDAIPRHGLAADRRDGGRRWSSSRC